MSTEPKIPVENGAEEQAERSQPERSSAPLGSARAAVDPRPRRNLQPWLHRSSIFLFVLVSAVAGVLLVILPWTPQWTDNYFVVMFPGLRSFLTNGFVRGICSGLGLLDIWIGFWEALHYEEKL